MLIKFDLRRKGIPRVAEAKYIYSPTAQCTYQLRPHYDELFMANTRLQVEMAPAELEDDAWYYTTMARLLWDNMWFGSQPLRFRVTEKEEPLPSGIAVYSREFPMFKQDGTTELTAITFALYVSVWKGIL